MIDNMKLYLNLSKYNARYKEEGGMYEMEGDITK